MINKKKAIEVVYDHEPYVLVGFKLGVAGSEIPSEFLTGPRVLELGRKMGAAVEKLSFGRRGISCRVLLGEQYKKVVVPWRAIFWIAGRRKRTDPKSTVVAFTWPESCDPQPVPTLPHVRAQA